MIKTAIIVTYNLKQILTLEGDYIGVEEGINYLNDHNIKMVASMCDLDSVTNLEKRQQILKSKNFIHKQDQIITDGEYAIKWALKNNYQKILLFCGGTRVDMDVHTFNLVLNYNVEAIVNEKNLIKKIEFGTNKIKPLFNDATFTIFAFKKNKINIKNALYNIMNYQVLKYDTRLVSNKFINNQAIIIEVLERNPEMILVSSSEIKT